MSKYLFLFRGGKEMDDASPEELQGDMEKWRLWMTSLAEAGKLHGGEPLQRRGSKVVRGRGRGISDGPFVEAKEVVGGYLVVEAADLAEAVELSKGCPVLDHDGSVEVRSFMPFSR